MACTLYSQLEWVCLVFFRGKHLLIENGFVQTTTTLYKCILVMDFVMRVDWYRLLHPVNILVVVSPWCYTVSAIATAIFAVMLGWLFYLWWWVFRVCVWKLFCVWMADYTPLNQKPITSIGTGFCTLFCLLFAVVLLSVFLSYNIAIVKGTEKQTSRNFELYTENLIAGTMYTRASVYQSELFHIDTHSPIQ